MAGECVKESTCRLQMVIANELFILLLLLLLLCRRLLTDWIKCFQCQLIVVIHYDDEKDASKLPFLLKYFQLLLGYEWKILRTSFYVRRLSNEMQFLWVRGHSISSLSKHMFRIMALSNSAHNPPYCSFVLTETWLCITKMTKIYNRIPWFFFSVDGVLCRVIFVNTKVKLSQTFRNSINLLFWRLKMILYDS